MNDSKIYNDYRNQVNEKIRDIFSTLQAPKLLKESMLYTVLNGGKRFRGLLILAIGDAILSQMESSSMDKSSLLNFAVAIECIHSYSLIHDDMPCMDDDAIRRGMPSNHIVYGEANALLAGDALLNFAYEYLLSKVEGKNQIDAISYLSKSAGVTGMIKGQSLDIYYENQEMDFEALKVIHKCKTGALIKAATTIPAILLDESKVNELEQFGEHLGLAFQITDDVLDVISTTQTLGKTPGKDEESNKLTYVKIFGVEKAKELAIEESKMAKHCLIHSGIHNEFLGDLVDFVVNRIS